MEKLRLEEIPLFLEISSPEEEVEEGYQFTKKDQNKMHRIKKHCNMYRKFTGVYQARQCDIINFNNPLRFEREHPDNQDQEGSLIKANLIFPATYEELKRLIGCKTVKIRLVSSENELIRLTNGIHYNKEDRIIQAKLRETGCGPFHTRYNFYLEGALLGKLGNDRLQFYSPD